MKLFFKSLSAVLFLSLLLYVGWLYKLDSQIQKRLEKGWFLPPVEIYSKAEQLWLNKVISPQKLIKLLKEQNFKSIRHDQKLHKNEFKILQQNQCLDKIKLDTDFFTESCIEYKTKDIYQNKYLISFDKTKINGLFYGPEYQTIERSELLPELFAQFYGDTPLQKQIIHLNQSPLQCLQAVTAIEDIRFLDHRGISFIGIFRAALKNLIKFRVSEGASTITQQLIKNYFLTPERSFSRKFKEISMALIIELRFSKDEILENYLNVIYMGQNSTFQVRGYGAAARHYFNKPIESLNLNECSLLAAIINSPGRYNPFTKKEAALKRRERVLQKMLDHNMIDKDEFLSTKKLPLPVSPKPRIIEPAAYYIQAIRRELKSLNINTEEGLKIYSALDVKAQKIAKQSIKQEIRKLENNSPRLKKNYQSGLKLQASLVSIDTKTGAVIALIGGRNFRQTQYNRVLEAHRQVGSIMKPLVYATALESLDENGNEFTPLTKILDEKFTHKYDGQSWSPKNYSKKFQGSLPLFYALKNSLNVPTAKLALKTGLPAVVDIAKRLGVKSPIKPLPSLSLGAYELYTHEVAQAYTSLANMGRAQKLYWIERVESLDGDTLYTHKKKETQLLSSEVSAVLISMLKQTLLTGTARSISQWRGFTHPAAGKTGTTSDTKDAWFVGFTPYNLTIVWLGYDNNKAHGLTGASGAVPIWTNFMKGYATQFPPDDFQWPESVQKITLTPERLKSMITDIKEHELIQTELYMRKSLVPDEFKNEWL